MADPKQLETQEKTADPKSAVKRFALHSSTLAKRRSDPRVVTLSPNETTATWGVPSIQGDTYAEGKVISMSVETSCEQEPLPDRYGETVGLAMFDEKDNLDIEIIVEQGTPMPAIGEALVIDGISGIVLSRSKKWENRGWMKFSCKATHFVAMDA